MEKKVHESIYIFVFQENKGVEVVQYAKQIPTTGTRSTATVLCIMMTPSRKERKWTKNFTKQLKEDTKLTLLVPFEGRSSLAPSVFPDICAS